MTIEVYAYPTPNNFKVLVALEALGLEYKINKVDIAKGEQAQESYLNINPCGLTPAIKDGSLNLSESINIVEYLAATYDKENKFTFPKDSPLFWKLNEFLFYHATGAGIAQDKIFWFQIRKPDQKDTVETFKQVTQDYYKKFEQKLAENGTGYFIGDKLSLADLVAYPHAKIAARLAGVDFDSLPHLKAWLEKIDQEPFIQKAYSKLA